MAGDTFLQTWRRMKTWCPTMPPSEMQNLIKHGYRRILDAHTWSFQYGLGRFIPITSIAATAAVTFRSSAVTLSAGVLSGDRTSQVGLQVIFNGRAPIYNVVDNPTPTTLTLDQGYGEKTNAAAPALFVSELFTSEKADFESLITMVDPINGFQFRKDVNQLELDNEDPQRTTNGTPQWLSGLAYNTDYLNALPVGITDRLGYSNTSAALPWFEVWPRPTSQQVYPYIYKRVVADPVLPNDRFIGVIRGDVVFQAALAQCCLWPGTGDFRNPMYNPVNHNIHERKFLDMKDDMLLRDKNIIERDLKWVATMTNLPIFSARFVQTHLLPASSMAGSGF